MASPRPAPSCSACSFHSETPAVGAAAGSGTGQQRGLGRVLRVSWVFRKQVDSGSKSPVVPLGLLGSYGLGFRPEHQSRKRAWMACIRFGPTVNVLTSTEIKRKSSALLRTALRQLREDRCRHGLTVPTGLGMRTTTEHRPCSLLSMGLAHR
jgi:hypothetical protein